MKKQTKPKVGFYGISGCSGCLLTILYEDCFTKLLNLVDIKSFPFIKEDNYKGEFDYCFIEGTVCFDEDIITINELRKRSKNIVALGSCACFGCVPSMKNFTDPKKTKNFVYPKHNHLRTTPPTPLHSHIKVDYSLPQCPPDKTEILDLIKHIVTARKWVPTSNPVCFECRKKGNPCLLDEGKVCLGPITQGGCGALCPSNQTTCYGCRGPSPDANYEAFFKMLQNMGHTKEEIKDKLIMFAGLEFKEKTKETSLWLEK
jgi:sulfhydrogenase subunit delta